MTKKDVKEVLNLIKSKSFSGQELDEIKYAIRDLKEEVTGRVELMCSDDDGEIYTKDFSKNQTEFLEELIHEIIYYTPDKELAKYKERWKDILISNPEAQLKDYGIIEKITDGKIEHTYLASGEGFIDGGNNAVYTDYDY